MKTIRLLIQGKVQGVFYRKSAIAFGRSIGLKGWVKNNTNGDVEALISGEESQLAQFMEWCKEGPPQAAVSNIVKSEEAFMLFEEFMVIRE